MQVKGFGQVSRVYEDMSKNRKGFGAVRVKTALLRRAGLNF